MNVIGGGAGGNGFFLGWGNVNKSIKTANTDLDKLKSHLKDIDRLLDSISKKAKGLKIPTGGGGGKGGTKTGSGSSELGLAPISSASSSSTAEGTDYTPRAGRYIDPDRPFSSYMVNRFPKFSMGVGVAAAAGGAVYSMLPTTEDAVARQQALFQATLGYGYGNNMNAFMKLRSNINNAFGNTMTSAISGTVSAAYLRNAGITVTDSSGGLTSTASRMMRGAGAFSMINGLSNEQNIEAMGNVGTNFAMGNRLMMLGIRTLDRKGNPNDIAKIANQIAKRSFVRTGGKFNSKMLDRALRGNLGANLAMYIPDENTRQLAIDALRVQAQNGGKYVEMTEDNLKKAGVYSNKTNPTASLAQRYSAEARQSVWDKGAMEGFDDANRHAANIINETTKRVGEFGNSLMKAKAYLETFSSTKPGGAVNSILSTLGTVLGLKMLGKGLGGGAGAGAGAGAGRLLSFAGKALKFGGRALGIVGGGIGLGMSVNDAYKSGKKDNKFNWGAVGGGALSGAGIGAGIGSFFTPAGTAIGAGIGAVVGGGIAAIGNLLGRNAGSDGYQTSIINGGAGIGTTAQSASGTRGSGAAELGTQYVGTKYVAGGRSPQGWDCAGFVYYVYKKMGIILPQVSWEQVKRGRKVSYSEAKPGDLLFFSMPKGHRHDPGPMKINHVGIYLGNGKMVNAMNPKDGTRVTSVWTQHLKAVRRVLGGGLGKNPNSLLTSGSNGSPISAGSILTMLTDYNETAAAPLLTGTHVTVSTSGINASLTSAADYVSNGGVYNPQTSTQSYSLWRGSSAPAVSTSSKSGGMWQGVRLYNLLKKVGFGGDSLRTAYGIVQAESHGNPNAHNKNRRSGDNSYGLFQINMLGQMGRNRAKQWGLNSYDELFDPVKNAELAYKISNGGKNFKAWTTYTSGDYKQYMPSKPMRGYSSGAWSVDSDQIAKIHQGEMIIPASVAEAVRTGVRQSFAGQRGAAGGAKINIYLNSTGSSAADGLMIANTVQKHLNAEAEIIRIGQS